MKILHVSTILEWRGGDNQLLTTYNILKDFPDFQQMILCADRSVLMSKCEQLAIPHFKAPRTSKFSIAFLKKIIEVVNIQKVDVLHVHDSNSFTLSLFALKFTHKLKFVYSRKRNNQINKNFFKNLKYNSSKIDKIICVSDAVRQVLLPIVNKKHKIEVIYDGIEVSKFQPKSGKPILSKAYNLNESTILIGNVAGLTRQKDLFTFLKTAEILLKKSLKELKFIIIGQGPLEEDLKKYALELKIEDHVIFAGFRNDVPQVLPEFDLFLLSSETEGLPLSIMEAFACKVPVVTTAAGGTGEAVISEVTGMISPVKDPSQLAENALKILTNESLKSKIIANAFEIVHEKFTLDVMKNNYYNFYKSLE